MSFDLLDGWPASIIVALLGYFATAAVARRMGLSFERTTALYIWHTIIAVGYAAYSLTTLADATMYFETAAYGDVKFAPGTDFVTYVTYLLQAVLGVNYLPITLVFATFGAVGLVVFDGCMKAATRGSSRLWRLAAYWAPFLPSLSFWSGGIGKDGIAFLAAALFTMAMFPVRNRVPLFVVSAVLMFLVRPHFTAIMIAAIVGATLLTRSVSIGLRGLILMTSLAFAIVAGPFVINYVGLRDGVDMQTLTDYIDTRQGYNLEGGSSVDLASMNPIMRAPAVVLRPTLLEARSAAFLVSAIENILLSVLFGWTLLRLTQRRTPMMLPHWKEGFFYSLMGIAILSQTVANLGIATRQKWMAMLPLLIICFAVLATHRLRAEATGQMSLSRNRNY